MLGLAFVVAGVATLQFGIYSILTHRFPFITQPKDHFPESVVIAVVGISLLLFGAILLMRRKDLTRSEWIERRSFGRAGKAFLISVLLTALALALAAIGPWMGFDRKVVAVCWIAAALQALAGTVLFIMMIKEKRKLRFKWVLGAFLQVATLAATVALFAKGV